MAAVAGGFIADARRTSPQKIQEAIRSGSIRPITQAPAWQRARSSAVTAAAPVQTDLAAYGLRSGLREVPKTQLVREVASIAPGMGRQSAVEMIQGVDARTRETVSALVRTASTQYRQAPSLKTLRELASAIHPLIGLTPKQATAVRRQRRALLASGASIADADAVMRRRIEGMIRQRSKMIADRGVIEAVSAARHRAWELAEDAGELENPHKAARNPLDGRERARHRSQALLPPIPLRQPYALFGVQHPPWPAPGCRCWEVLVALPAVELPVEAETARPKTLSGAEVRRRFRGSVPEQARERARLANIRAGDAAQDLQDFYTAVDEHEASIPTGRASPATAKWIAESERLNLRREPLRRAVRVAEEELRDATDSLRDAQRRAAVDLLSEGKTAASAAPSIDIGPTTVGLLDEWPQATLDGATTAVRDVFKIWGLELPDDITHVHFRATREKRAFYTHFGDDRSGTIKLHAGSRSRTATHELGHWLEEVYPDVHDKVVEFLLRRAGKERPRHLGGGYRPDEDAFFDDFLKPYMGKLYKTIGRPLTDQNAYTATEILSMGLEHLLYNTAEFAAKDPEMFDFIVDLLRGAI